MLKKFILLSILFSVSLFANSSTIELVVNTPNEVDSYAQVLNAIATIFKSGTYESIIRLVFLLGGFYIFSTDIIHSWKRKGTKALQGFYIHLFIVIPLLMFIYAKGVDVSIKSRYIPDYCSTDNSYTQEQLVSNVPYFVGKSFEFFNSFGENLTHLAEKSYTSPAQIHGSDVMSQNGFVGALSKSLKILGSNFKEANVTINGVHYSTQKLSSTLFSQCILVPFSGKGVSGQEEIDKITSSGNIALKLEELYKDCNETSSNDNSKVIGGIHAGQYEANLNGITEKCCTIYNAMAKAINKYKDNAACSAYKGVGAGAIRILTNNINPPLSSFKDEIVQSGLINSFADTKSNISIGIQGQSYAVGKSLAEYNSVNYAKGAYMSGMLPYMQSSIRLIMYAMLPFVFVIVFFAGGIRILVNYLKSLIWVELWTPVAAILNMFLTSATSNNVNNIITQYNGLTSVNQIEVADSIATMAGVSGYLYALIPALTWLIIKGSDSMIDNIFSGLASVVAKNIKTESTLKDVEAVEERKRLSISTGEQFSLAEAGYFKALSMGAKSGATLGVEKDIGLETVSSLSEFNERKKIASFKQLQTLLGGSIQSRANQFVIPKTFEDTVKANAYDRVAGVDGSETSFGHQLEKVSTNEIKGSQDGKVQTNLSENEYSSIEKGKIDAMLSMAKVVEAFGGTRNFAEFDSGLKSWNMRFQAAQQETFGNPTAWGHSSASASKFNVYKTLAIKSILGVNAVTKAATSRAFGIDKTNETISKLGGYTKALDITSTAKAMSALTSSKVAHGLGGVASASSYLANMKILGALKTQDLIQKIGGGSISATADIMSDVQAGNTLGAETAIGLAGGLPEYVRKYGQQKASILDITAGAIDNMGYTSYIDGGATSLTIQYNKALAEQQALENVTDNSKGFYNDWQDVVNRNASIKYINEDGHVITASGLIQNDGSFATALSKEDGGDSLGRTLVGTKIAQTYGMTYSEYQILSEMVSFLRNFGFLGNILEKTTPDKFKKLRLEAKNKLWEIEEKLKTDLAKRDYNIQRKSLTEEKIKRTENKITDLKNKYEENLRKINNISKNLDAELKKLEQSLNEAIAKGSTYEVSQALKEMNELNRNLGLLEINTNGKIKESLKDAKISLQERLNNVFVKNRELLENKNDLKTLRDSLQTVTDIEQKNKLLNEIANIEKVINEQEKLLLNEANSLQRTLTTIDNSISSEVASDALNKNAVETFKNQHFENIENLNKTIESMKDFLEKTETRINKTNLSIIENAENLSAIYKNVLNVDLSNLSLNAGSYGISTAENIVAATDIEKNFMQKLNSKAPFNVFKKDIDIENKNSLSLSEDAVKVTGDAVVINQAETAKTLVQNLSNALNNIPADKLKTLNANDINIIKDAINRGGMQGNPLVYIQPYEVANLSDNALQALLEQSQIYNLTPSDIRTLSYNELENILIAGQRADSEVELRNILEEHFNTRGVSNIHSIYNIENPNRNTIKEIGNNIKQTTQKIISDISNKGAFVLEHQAPAILKPTVEYSASAIKKTSSFMGGATVNLVKATANKTIKPVVNVLNYGRDNLDKTYFEKNKFHSEYLSKINITEDSKEFELINKILDIKSENPNISINNAYEKAISDMPYFKYSKVIDNSDRFSASVLAKTTANTALKAIFNVMDGLAVKDSVGYIFGENTDLISSAVTFGRINMYNKVIRHNFDELHKSMYLGVQDDGFIKQTGKITSSLWESAGDVTAYAMLKIGNFFASPFRTETEKKAWEEATNKFELNMAKDMITTQHYIKESYLGTIGEGIESFYHAGVGFITNSDKEIDKAVKMWNDVKTKYEHSSISSYLNIAGDFISKEFNAIKNETGELYNKVTQPIKNIIDNENLSVLEKGEKLFSMAGHEIYSVAKSGHNFFVNVEAKTISGLVDIEKATVNRFNDAKYTIEETFSGVKHFSLEGKELEEYHNVHKDDNDYIKYKYDPINSENYKKAKEYENTHIEEDMVDKIKPLGSMLDKLGDKASDIYDFIADSAYSAVGAKRTITNPSLLRAYHNKHKNDPLYIKYKYDPIGSENYKKAQKALEEKVKNL